MKKDNRGTVYLLHFNDYYKHALHYIGFTTNLDARMKKHRKGHGSRLVKAVMKSGSDFTVTRTWEIADRHFERKLKKRKNSKHLCPVCDPNALKKGVAT